jgi:hypothetical protein
MVAYACRISEENLGVIASEHPGFDREETLRWIEEHGEGYFLRDDASSFDCQYFVPEVFQRFYSFEPGNEGELFRRVLRIY